jgi:hypothetical protein
MLEPTALKSARWVLRGEGGGNASFLPDWLWSFDQKTAAIIDLDKMEICKGHD